MVNIGYRRMYHVSGSQQLTIKRDKIRWTPRALPKLTASELAMRPESFRCYMCGQTRSKSHFAAFISKQPICRRCYPWLDDGHVNATIAWDIRHKFGQYIRD